jgi:hypothetical protein
MRGLLPAVVLVITSYATLADDDVEDTKSDECALLAVRSTAVQRSSLGSQEGAAHKGRVAMQRVLDSFNNDAVSSFEWLNKVLGMQKTVLVETDASQEAKQQQFNQMAAEVAARACANDLGPCWSQTSGPLIHQPAYPYEPLLDDDFIHNAGNWLDEWMDEKHNTGKKKSTTSSAAAADKADNADNADEAKENELAFSGSCYIRTTEPLGNAPPGTKCLFGIVGEDGGSHCIYDNGKYGAFGWCFTSNDKKEWGSCTQTCPTAGNAKVLVAKINTLQNQIVKLLQKLQTDTKDAKAQ